MKALSIILSTIFDKLIKKYSVSYFNSASEKNRARSMFAKWDHLFYGWQQSNFSTILAMIWIRHSDLAQSRRRRRSTFLVINHVNEIHARIEIRDLRECCAEHKS